MANENKIHADREILKAANEKGSIATFFAFFRLSGPGWLQAAITLGGGSLGSALYLGVLGGYSMLWLQLVAIVAGVIMLSAISYVTLSTGKRPFQAINQYINPVLGVGWIIATILANMIWVMPQFSLCFDAIDNNLAGKAIEENEVSKWGISIILFMLATLMVYLSSEKGFLSKLFDLFLKLVIAVIIVCFVGVVVVLFRQGNLDFSTILGGFVPDISQWWEPSSKIQEVIAGLPDAQQEIWRTEIVKTQQDVMISTAATAVGINMTFLLPYSLLARGWDRPFRGLARFDLVTGMAIPFVLVTSCIVIAASYSFHGKVDPKLLSDDPTEIKESSFFGKVAPIIVSKVLKPNSKEYASELTKINSLEEEISLLKAKLAKKWFDEETTNRLKDKTADLKTEIERVFLELAPSISVEDKTLASVLVKPSTNQLAQSLEPFLGKKWANVVFGAGALAMGFSTIIILMMINGYAIREMFGKPDSQFLNMMGAVAAGIMGVCYPVIWGGASKTWLIIMASTFGAMLLPIAYVAFFCMMNNKSLMGEHKPTGGRMILWNVLMIFGVFVALAQAISSIYTKIGGEQGMFVVGAAVSFVILAIVGFSAKSIGSTGPNETTES